MISEQSIDLDTQLATQAPLHPGSHSFDSVSAHGLSSARAHAKFKPKFADFTCSHTEVRATLISPLPHCVCKAQDQYTQVFFFARLITKEVIPNALWGSDYNFNIIMKGSSSKLRLSQLQTNDALLRRQATCL